MKMSRLGVGGGSILSDGSNIVIGILIGRRIFLTGVVFVLAT